MPALSTPRALRGSFQRAGALTVTTPAAGRTPVSDCSAACRNTAIAPIDSPTNTTGPDAGLVACTAAATSWRSRSPRVHWPSDSP
jgi:hypothetical protein